MLNKENLREYIFQQQVEQNFYTDTQTDRYIFEEDIRKKDIMILSAIEDLSAEDFKKHPLNIEEFVEIERRIHESVDMVFSAHDPLRVNMTQYPLRTLADYLVQHIYITKGRLERVIERSQEKFEQRTANILLNFYAHDFLENGVQLPQDYILTLITPPKREQNVQLVQAAPILPTLGGNKGRAQFEGVPVFGKQEQKKQKELNEAKIKAKKKKRFRIIIFSIVALILYALVNQLLQPKPFDPSLVKPTNTVATADKQKEVEFNAKLINKVKESTNMELTEFTLKKPKDNGEVTYLYTEDSLVGIIQVNTDKSASIYPDTRIARAEQKNLKNPPITWEEKDILQGIPLVVRIEISVDKSVKEHTAYFFAGGYFIKEGGEGQYSWKNI